MQDNKKLSAKIDSLNNIINNISQIFWINLSFSSIWFPILVGIYIIIFFINSISHVNNLSIICEKFFSCNDLFIKAIKLLIKTWFDINFLIWNLFAVYELIIIKSFNNLYFMSLLLKSLFIFSSKFFKALSSISSICTPCPGNFFISFIIKSIELIIFSSLINLICISKREFIIFCSAKAIKFFWLKKHIFLMRWIDSKHNLELFVVSKNWRINFMLPFWINILYISFLYSPKAMNVFIVSKLISSSKIFFLKRLTKEFIYTSNISCSLNLNIFSLLIKKNIFFLNCFKWFTRLNASEDFSITSIFKFIINFIKSINLSSLFWLKFIIIPSSIFLKAFRHIFIIFVDFEHFSLYDEFISFSFDFSFL